MDGRYLGSIAPSASGQTCLYQSVASTLASILNRALPAGLPVGNVCCMQEFFREHDPTQRCKAQYKSAVWYHSDEQRQAVERAIAGLKAKYGLRQIATTVDPARDWYDAEEYHQKCEWRRGRLSVGRWGGCACLLMRVLWGV